jgi:TolB-like protein/DNA-binding winged helix-turn-helix (wHTH) protein/Flp pilus assembly protein TadD
MAGVSQSPRILRFGPCELDLREGDLYKNGLTVKLQGQPLQVLAFLVTHPREVVSREELREELWPGGTFVDFDQGLNTAINKIREALGDDAETPRYIETLHRRGYRFIAPVEHVERATLKPTGFQDSEPKRPIVNSRPALLQGSRRILVLWVLPVAIAGALVSVLSVRVWQPHFLRGANANTIRSVAVLPLANVSGDPGQEYLSEGMTEALITDLAKIPDLRVISRTSVIHYKGASKTLPEIARELNVDAVVEGTVARSGDRVRVTANLVQASPEKHLWADSYEGDLSDLLSLQDNVAREVAEKVGRKIMPQFRGQLAALDREAQEDYLKGRYFWNKRTEAGYVKAISYFQSAIERSPRYAQAYAGLADAYALLGSMPNEEISRAEAMPKAKAAAISALQLDDSLAEAHTSLAFVEMHYDWDWKGAEREFRRAIELNPNYPTAHHWYAYDLAALNRMPEALNEIWRAQQVDPLSAIINTDVAELLYYAGRYDQAIQQANVALEIDPQFLLAHSLLGEIYGEQHRYSEALAEGKRAVELSGGSPWMLARLGRTYALSGDRSQAEQVLRQLVELSARRKVMSGVVAGVAAALGKNDEAFAAGQKACEERDGGLMLLKYDHFWDPLRSDPRFQQLLRRVGLPP